MILRIQTCVLLMASLLFCCAARANNCSNLPTQFNGNEFPTGDFFSNFQNPCYLIPLSLLGAGGDARKAAVAPDGTPNDLNDTEWRIVYTVDPRYQLIVVANFPNARYFSVTAYDDHGLISQSILDTNIVPLTASDVNPFQTGVPYAPGQPYAIPINFGGSPGVLETGCMTNGYNVDVNALDGSQRHQGINWNTDPGFFQTSPLPPVHNIDTPQHTNPTTGGYLLIRAYVDIGTADPTTAPSLIVRDVASGCAYPASYALQTLQIVNQNAPSSLILDEVQFEAHQNYSNYLPFLCYASDSRNSVSWARDREGGSGPNPNATYLTASLPANLSSTLAAAQEVMRIRLQVPATPPTPCTNGCSRSGGEQLRYYGLSLESSGPTLASLADYNFTQDANGYATLIVGTGASIPSWITPANGYTFLDLTAIPGYQSLQALDLREILESANYSCGAQIVPYKSSVFTPSGSLMGDALPVVDYPLAASLPQVASELVGPNACGALPVGLPQSNQTGNQSCGMLPPNPSAITSIPAPAPGASPVAAQPAPPITLSGEGFGFLPKGLPYNGNSNYLEIGDFTQGWSAGYTGNPCDVSVSYWSDNRIELVANVNQNGLCPLAAGDQLSISVWNPQTMAPATATLAVGSGLGYALGANSMLVSSGAGAGAVELMTAGYWTAQSNASWLTLSSASFSGVGSALIEFTYDANTNSTPQTGTLTIAGLTFTVTQAGAGFSQAAPIASVVAGGLNAPQGVAVDGQGDIYIADTGNAAVKEWSAASGQLTSLTVTGITTPVGVAVDTQGNVYIADAGNHAIEEWLLAGSQWTSLVQGLSSPYGVAVDAQGNVYLSDSAANLVAEFHPPGQQINAPPSGSGIGGPLGIAVDGLGNLYFANTANNAIEQWNLATGQVNILVSGLSGPSGVTVDGQDNVYFTDTGNHAVKQWNPATQQVATLIPGLNSPTGIAVDGQGNLYVADQASNTVQEFTFAYLSLSAASRSELASAGTDSIAVQVLPATTPLTAYSDQPWLTIAGVTAGSIAFGFQANPLAVSRTAHITVSGQQVTVTQGGAGASTLTKSAGDGQSAPAGQPFPIALQVTVADAYGNPVPGAPVTFSVTPGSSGASGIWNPNPAMPVMTDQNGNVTAPTLTANNIAGQFTVAASTAGVSVTFTLTNLLYTLSTAAITAGSAAGSGSLLISAAGPWTVSSDSSWLTVSAGSQSGIGNAAIDFDYAANSSSSPRIGTLTISGLTLAVTQADASDTPVNMLTTLLAALKSPRAVAVGGNGNVYVANSQSNTILEWIAATGQIGTLVSSGLNDPTGVAVDSSGNVYIADSKNNAIKEWVAATGQVKTLVASGLITPVGVALDSQGNLYFSDSGHGQIKKWTAANGVVTTLVSSGKSDPQGVAVDALGNVYFADGKNNTVSQWNPVNNTVIPLVSAGLNKPYGLAVDSQGNVFIADVGNNAIKQWNPVSNQVTILPAGTLVGPRGVAVDSLGNVYVADTGGNNVVRLTSAYLSLGTTSRTESARAGADSVTYQVLPAGAPLTATSNERWLTITGMSNGSISFSFKGNSATTSRTAVITVGGLQITVTQSGRG